MKQIIFIILISAILLTACSKKENIQSGSVYKDAIDDARGIQVKNDEKNNFEKMILDN